MPLIQKDIIPPLAGVVRSAAFQSQQPYSAVDALNVRPRDVFEKRGRVGSRPALQRAYTLQGGSSGKREWRMLLPIRPTQLAGGGSFFDDFDGTSYNSAAWEDSVGVGPDGLGTYLSTVGIMRVGAVSISSTQHNQAAYVGDYRTYAAYQCGLVHAVIADLDTSKAYKITAKAFAVYAQIEGTPTFAQKWSGSYRIFGQMNDGTPRPNVGSFVVDVNCNRLLARYDVTLWKVIAGVTTSVSTGNKAYIDVTGTLTIEVLVNGTSVVVNLNGTTIVNGTVGAAVGKRWGFGLINDQELGGPNDRFATAFDSVAFSYTPLSASTTRRSQLVASSGGLLYTEDDSGSLNLFAGTGSALTLSYSHAIQAAERTGQAWIADYDVARLPYGAVPGTGGTVTTHVLDDPAVSDWTAALGGGFVINKNDDVVVIYNASDSTANGTYKITNIHATNGLTLSPTTIPNCTCSYRVERAPKTFDPTAGVFQIWFADAGQVPTGCPCVALYQDRIVLAGSWFAPQVFYMSRRGDPTDFDYGANPGDPNRAYAGDLGDSGVVGAAINCIISGFLDYLIFGCDTSLWVLRGDPTTGGFIRALSRKVGVIDKLAWCYGPGGEIYFMSKEGVYVVAPGALPPTPLSREKLPAELLNIDTGSYQVSLEYNSVDRGIEIHLSPLMSGSATSWWLDLVTGGFWPMSFDPTQQAMVLRSHQLTDNTLAVLYGGRDGYIRRPVDGAPDDDGVALSSYLLIGPIKLGGKPDTEGVLNELVGTLSTLSGAVTWGVLVGDTIEDAASATAQETGTWTADLNYTEKPQCRGFAAFIKISSTSAWALENIIASISQRGSRRLLTR